MESLFNLNNKCFRASENSSGVSSSETIFTYKQNGILLSGEYKGGEIESGNLVGKFTSPDTIELLFQCKTKSNELLSGKSEGKISQNTNRKLGINFNWQWLSGSKGAGNSYHEEI